MKKLIYICLFICLFTLVGCNSVEYINYNNKPSKTYYSDKLQSSIKDKIQSVRIIENNFFKEISLDENQINLLYEMINEIDSTDLISNDLLSEAEKCLFKIYIETQTDEFIIDVYGNDILTIYPWDGIYEKDIISLNKSPLSLKPESICKFMFKNQ